MDAPVFWEKVRPPDPRGLSRQRLEDRLAADEVATGLVLAPAGSGKTTLLSRVAAQSSRPCAWYRADAEDADEAALVRHLVHAVRGALVSRSGTSADSSADPLPACPDVASLVEALQLRPEPLLLVLDDVHELAGKPAERALDRLVALRPRHVRILLGSRRPPAINVSRLLVSGDLVQLDAEDLRFRSWETEELFRAVYREPLGPETAAALTRRTGGWAAGLQLFHLGSGSLSRPEREQAVAALGGRSRLIRSYLARNVLSGLAAERRAFLLRTCTLGVLTGATCDELLGTTGSAAVLDDLEQDQFFTTSVDDGATFRYHQVLQTHLEVVLADELGEDAVRALYARSAALLERTGRTTAAVRAYARAGDWSALARLLPTSPSAPLPDEALGLSGGHADDPGLLVAWARRLVADGHVQEAVDAFRRAETAMDDLEFRERCAADRRLASTFAPSPELRLGEGADTALRLAVEVRAATLDLRARETARTPLGRALAAFLAADLDACRTELADAEGTGDRVAVEMWASDALAEVADALWHGRPPSLAVLDEIGSRAERAGVRWLGRLLRGLQAAALLAKDASPGHQAACADLLDDGEQRGDPWSQALVATALGAAALLQGLDEVGARWLSRAETAARAVDAPVLEAWSALLRGSRTGSVDDPTPDPAAAARRLRTLGVPVPSSLLAGIQPTGRRSEVPAPTHPTGGIALRTLGGFSLRVDGAEVGWAALRPRAVQVLLVLALHHGRPVHREHLVDALWPDTDLAPGVRSLQVAVSSVRQALTSAGLADVALDRRGEAYVLQLPGCSDQRAAFEAAVTRGDREAAAGGLADALSSRQSALELYAGELLPEVGPAEWVLAERARLARLAVLTAVGAAELALRLDDVPTAIAAAARAVELDPYSDLGWRLLGAAHERNGDDSAASVVRREHRRVVAELGVEAAGVDALPEAPVRRLVRPPVRRSRAERAPA